MDTARGIDDRIDDELDQADDNAVSDTPVDVGTDERRMHVRAYNYWVSLLHGRAYPSIEDLEPADIADFGPHSVLIDFTKGIDDPAIRFLGAALRIECEVDGSISRVADVPSRSLLSRLTDHYLQIIANRTPIGFEAEFVGQRGHNTLYRGILMPFSSDGERIDFIYGVINWKETVDEETQTRLTAELEEARRSAPKPAATAPVWADGPGVAGDGDDDEAFAQAGLADRLVLARESAAQVEAADTRSRGALYRALGRAYDFALATDANADDYAELLEDAGLKVQERAPMTPIVKLVFGSDYDKARITEFAAALANAKRNAVAEGGFTAFIEDTDGGLKALVKAEREARRGKPKPAPVPFEAVVTDLRKRPALAQVPMGAGDEEFVVLLARKSGVGTLDVVARVEGDERFTEKALRRAAK